jgi:hypothetical protein
VKKNFVEKFEQTSEETRKHIKHISNPFEFFIQFLKDHNGPEVWTKACSFFINVPYWKF